LPFKESKTKHNTIFEKNKKTQSWYLVLLMRRQILFLAAMKTRMEFFTSKNPFL